MDSSKSEFRKALNSICDSLQRDITDLLKFHRFVQDSIKNLSSIARAEVDALSDEDRGEYERVVSELESSLFQQHFDSTSLVSNVVVKAGSTNVLRTLKQSYHAIEFPIKFFGLLDNIVLVQGVVLLESFLKAYLTIIFKYRVNYLASDKKLSYKELVTVKDKNHLIELMVNKEIYGLGYGSLLDRFAYIKKRFKIDISSDFKDVNLLLKAGELRNDIVHQRGADKLLGADPERSSIPPVETIPLRLVDDCLMAVFSFASFLHGQMTDKLKIC